MNKKLKTLSALIAAMMILLSFGSASVFADGEIPVQFDYVVESDTVTAGNVFDYGLSLKFNEADVENAGGIIAFRCLIKFDPEVLQPVDPYTGEALEFEDGKAVSGSVFKFYDIGSSKSLAYNMSSDGKTLVLVYGGVKEESNIYRSGKLADFRFKVRDDISFDGSMYTNVTIESPEVSVQERDIKTVPTSEKIGFKIVPPFNPAYSGDVQQGTKLEISENARFSKDNTTPVTVSIIKDGGVVKENNALTSRFRYSTIFDIDKETFPAGKYTIRLSWNNITLDSTFNIVEKSETSDPVTPTNPTDPDDGKRDDDKKDDNNTGGGTNTGGSRNNGTGGTNQTKPDNTAESNKPADSGNKPQATIKYPSDLAGHWAESNVKYVYDNALMNGYSDGTFKPDASITRAEFSAVMARFLKLDDKASAAEKFGDVKGHWAIGYIGALADKGIVGGVTENSFAPDDNITREQMAAILSRAFDLKETSPEVFADNGEISDWARDYVYACRKAGYMNGDAVNNFSPLDNASRAEVATVIYRLHSAK